MKTQIECHFVVEKIDRLVEFNEVLTREKLYEEVLKLKEQITMKLNNNYPVSAYLKSENKFISFKDTRKIERAYDRMEKGDKITVELMYDDKDYELENREEEF